MELLYVLGALVAGFAVGAAGVLLLAPRRRLVEHQLVTRPATPPGPSSPSPATPPWSGEFEFRPAPAPHQRGPAFPEPPMPPMAPRPAEPDDAVSAVPTEWARRLVGPPEAGRIKGVCSGCGTALSVSARRPLKIVCPVCGRTRLLA